MSKSELRTTVRAAIERSILQIAVRNGTVTADDVRQKVTIPPELDPRIVGAAFLALKLAGWIVEIGDLHTGRPVAHSRMIRVWRLGGDPSKIAARFAEPTPDMPTKTVQHGLFDQLDDAGQTNAGETAATVSPALNTSINPQRTGDHCHGSTL